MFVIKSFMADEATLTNGIETHLPVNFTKATGTALEKGAICKMTTPMTAALSDGDGDIVAGIVHTEVTAAEASPSVSIYREGIFVGTAGVAGVTCGHSIQTDSSTSSANRLVDTDVNTENIVGVALSTATSGNTFTFELKPTHVNLA